MRTVLSALFGMLFVAAFIAFFLLSSVVDYVEFPEGIVETANEGGLREAIVEHTAEYIAQEVAADPSLQTMSVAQLRGIVGGVITKEWLERALTQAHEAFKNALHGAEETAVLDLRGIKSALGQALSELKARAETSCSDLLGAEACADEQASKVMVAAFEVRALTAIAQLHDEIDLLAQFQGPARQDAREVQKGLESFQTVRMLSLVVLIMSLALFIAFNSRPWSRMAMATGVLAIATSVIYLLVVEVSERMASDEVVKQASAESATQAAEIGAELTNRLVADAVSGSTLPVVMVGLGGLGLVLGATLLRRR